MELDASEKRFKHEGSGSSFLFTNKDAMSHVFECLKEFKLQSKIGSGSHGEVFQVHSNELKRDLALKLFISNSNPYAFVSASGEFSQEVTNLTKFNHDRLIKIYKAGCVQITIEGNDYRVYYTLVELVECTLAEWAQQHSQLGLQQFRIFANDLISGVRHMWMNGIMHNDLHLGNVGVVQDPILNLLRLKILDLDRAGPLKPTSKELTYVINHLLALANKLEEPSRTKVLVLLTDALKSPLLQTASVEALEILHHMIFMLLNYSPGFACHDLLMLDNVERCLAVPLRPEEVIAEVVDYLDDRCPADFQKIHDEIVAKLTLDATKNRNLWNGENLAPKKIELSAIDRSVKLNFHHVMYFHHCAMQRIWFQLPKDHPEKRGDNTLFWTSLGVHVSLLVDGHIAFMLRSKTQFVGQTTYTGGFTETVSVKDIRRDASGKEVVDLWAAACRGAKEELNLVIQPDEVKLLGFGCAQIAMLHGFVGVADLSKRKIPVLREKIEQGWKQSPKPPPDGWEFTRIEWIRADIPSVAEFLVAKAQSRELGFGTFACAIVCLYYLFGKFEVDSAFISYLFPPVK